MLQFIDFYLFLNIPETVAFLFGLCFAAPLIGPGRDGSLDSNLLGLCRAGGDHWSPSWRLHWSVDEARDIRRRRIGGLVEDL